MMDLSPFTGIGQFGPAYRVMLANDCHAPGSVDRVLMERMVRLCPDTATYLYIEHTPTPVRYERGSRPELESLLREAIAGCGSDDERIADIAGLCASTAERGTEDLDATLVGGTEEEIITRGSDWCTDLARVGCVLYQVAGYPSRIVYLADTDQAYSGHANVEVYRRGVWGAVDSTSGVVYLSPGGHPVTTWKLMNQPEVIEAHAQSTRSNYTRPGQFRHAAISNYNIWDRGAYDYAVSSMNEYYRSILRMSAAGWPGGLRWHLGEDAH